LDILNGKSPKGFFFFQISVRIIEMDILKNLEEKISQGISYFRDQLSGIRGGRPSSKMVEDIAVDYFGQRLTVKQLGSITVIPPREINISVWDKNSATLILKAIEASNLNVSANLDGNAIRINLPPLSGERRQELAKLVKKESEEARIKMRAVRDDANKEISKRADNGEMGEDDKFKFKDDIQKTIDKANQEIERIVENKIGEIEE
jgi:ribosome recycling factor